MYKILETASGVILLTSICVVAFNTYKKATGQQ